MKFAKKIRFWIGVFILVMIPWLASAADKIVLYTGEIIQGNIHTIQKNVIYYHIYSNDKTKQEQLQSIVLDKVKTIVYENQIQIDLSAKQSNNPYNPHWDMEPEHYLHNGFFAQIQLGYQANRGKLEIQPGYSPVNKNSGAFLAAQIGGAIDWNWLLFLHLGIQSVRQTNMTTMDSFNENNADLVKLSWQPISEIGIGLTHYIMPHNIFFSLAFLSKHISMESDPAPPETPQAMYSQSWNGLRLTAGKEWWLSANGAFGFSLWTGLYYHKKNFMSVFGLALNLTYN